MKTSNKILIAFAAALILIPVLGMVIVSATQYKKGTYTTDRFQAPDESLNNLEKATVGYVKKDLAGFKKIEIADGKGLAFQLSVINSDKYGVKIPSDFKDNISFSVDNDGILQIKFDDKLNRSGNNGYGVIILVYAPSISKINASTLGTLTLNTEADSLTLAVKDTETVNFGSSVTYHGNRETTDNHTKVQNLTLDLESSSFNSYNNSFNNLSINASKNSSIEIWGEDESKDKYSIENLNLNTQGNVKVRVENIRVKNSSADVSDSTDLAVPTYMLKQMFKK